MSRDRQPKEIKELVIDRATWHRGDGFRRSALLTPYDTQCCLGFLASEAGYKREEILNVPSPASLCRTLRIETPNLFPPGVFRGEWLGRAMGLNDDPRMADSERERLLTDHFKKIGIDLVFTGETSEKIRKFQEEEIKR